MLLRSIASRRFLSVLGQSRSATVLQSTRYSRWAGLGVVVASGVITAAASAQPGTPAPAAPLGGTQVGFERHVQLSPQQEEAQAELLIGQMQATAATTQRMLAQARLAHDVVKTLCLNDKLSQVDVAGRSAADREASLHAAAGRGDQELSNHEFTILTVLKKRTEQLSAEANQCIGEEAAFIGATNVVTTVDVAMPTGDQTDMPPSTSAPPNGPPISASSEL
jgi:hypothetical protein